MKKHIDMKTITSNDQFNRVLTDNPLVLTYFSGEKCNVCLSLKPKIEMILSERFPTLTIIEIPTGQYAELSARNSVFTVPAILFWVEGREYFREARNISVDSLASKIEKIVSLYE